MTPVEAFRKCPDGGCSTSVWGSTSTENYCRAHGGNVLGFPETSEDEWGEPITPKAAAGFPPSWPPATPPEAS